MRPRAPWRCLPISAVIPEVVQERWVGEPVRMALSFNLLGERRTISGEPLNVTALLSGIVGLYFTGQAVAEPGHREEHFAHVVAAVGELLAARTLYVSALDGRANQLVDDVSSRRRSRPADAG